jgi:hypothetical protein
MRRSTRHESHIADFWQRLGCNSTYTDLASCTQSRFNAMDVKLANYSIDSIDFYESGKARVRCSAQVRVISLIPGIDIDSGSIKAVVEWRREDGVWKVWRNLPYRFTHPATSSNYFFSSSWMRRFTSSYLEPFLGAKQQAFPAGASFGSFSFRQAQQHLHCSAHSPRECGSF